MHVHEVLDHIDVFRREHVLVVDGGEPSFEGLDFLDVVAVLMALHKWVNGWLGRYTGIRVYRREDT